MLDRGPEKARLDHDQALRMPRLGGERPRGVVKEEKHVEQQRSQHHYCRCPYAPEVFPSQLRDELEDEKQRCPGANTWAKEEHRLFEILYLRQDLPLLPAHWGVDFRAVPMDASLFASSPEHPPIIYAHSKKQCPGGLAPLSLEEGNWAVKLTLAVAATNAILRLLDLTATTRANFQLGMRHKTPWRIKKVLDSLITWAAEDGGYKDINYVPNMVVDVVGENLDEPRIIDYMERRMRALVRLQRDFLHAHTRIDFWDVDFSQTRYCPNVSPRTDALLDRYMGPRSEAPASKDELQPLKLDAATDKGERLESVPPNEALATPPCSARSAIPTRRTIDAAHERTPRPTCVEERDDDVEADDILVNDETPCATPVPIRPASAAWLSPRAEPHATVDVCAANPASEVLPVVYGLFILSSSVILVTADAAKGDAAQISVHVDLHFMDRPQSVWNALTIALAVCVARDLMARIADFAPVAPPAESDPDA